MVAEQSVIISEGEIRNIVKASELVLSVCDGAAKRDEEGFDMFDAGHFRGFLRYPDVFGVEELTPEEVEFMRRKLLRYKGQLEQMGFDSKTIDAPIHDVCFFAYGKDWKGNYLRVSPHSMKNKFLDIFSDLKKVEESGNWVRMYIKFTRDLGSPLKELWVRLNDITLNGKTRKWWESKGKGEEG